jgi:phenylpropionate dioxygenase-like ring-hydroxylating dioxygenase large terminal subunit
MSFRGDSGLTSPRGAIRGDVERVLASLSESARPVEHARALPAEAYRSLDFFEFEKEAVFMHSWLCVGRVQQVPEPGDFLAVTPADEPLLIVRGADDTIRAMSAVCRHRGHPLRENCTGNAARFVCPYHNWTYGLDGSFIGAPHMRKTVPTEVLRAESRLPAVKVEIWHGFIFVNLDDAAPPLAPTLTKLDPYMQGYDLDAMVTIPPRFAPEPLPLNWKLLLENFIEPYHTEFVHPGVHDFAPSATVEFDSWRDGDNAISRGVPFLAPDGGITETGWATPALFPVIESLSQKQRRQVGFAVLPPTMNFAFTPDMLCYGLTYPVGPTSLTTGGGCFTFGGWCVPKATAQLPDFDERIDRLVTGLKIFGAQDEAVNSAMQRTKYSRFAPRGRFCHLEETLSQFNRWLGEKYRAQAERMRLAQDLSVPVKPGARLEYDETAKSPAP